VHGPWELHPQVALRPEPFGALAYHYGNRRLTFLRSPELVELVRSLGEHASLDDALAASGIAPARWASYRTAVESLAASELLREKAA
jgi:putative mycofactocin binding protein MftB